MKILQMDYSMKLEFSVPVTEHYFLLRCVPVSRGAQTVVSYELSVEPNVVLNKSEDIFGNASYMGVAHGSHTSFGFHSKATVMVDTAAKPKEKCLSMYKYPTPLTKCSDEMADFVLCVAKKIGLEKQAAEKRIPSGLVKKFAEKLREDFFENFNYVPGSTNVTTAADEAFALKKGVCQDYAHIYCAMLRRAGIASRYVCGTSCGEGSTHAWTEFFVPDDEFISVNAAASGRWIAADPTRNKWCDDTYIVLSCGRDFADCQVDRGIFTGNADQTLTVFVKTEESENPLPENTNTGFRREFKARAGGHQDQQ